MAFENLELQSGIRSWFLDAITIASIVSIFRLYKIFFGIYRPWNSSFCLKFAMSSCDVSNSFDKSELFESQYSRLLTC